jgi:ornithine cyclodeaminase/alanine dehydrogenase
MKMTGSPEFLCLSDETLTGLGISTAEVVDCIESAIRAEAAGRLWTAPKAALLPGDGRYIMATLAAAHAPPVVTVKAVTVNPRNPARGLDSINGAIMLLDSETGLLRAVLCANWVTAIRTAGLSAVVAKRLADPKSASVAFIGCGVQARSHLDTFRDLFPLADIRAFGRGRANIDRLCATARAKGLAARACGSAREAVEGADLVVTSVSADYEIEPFVDAHWLKPGAFAAITDLAIPWKPEGMSAFDTVIIDSAEQEAASDKPMVRRDLVGGDLRGLVAGRLGTGFEAGNRSAFVFRGLAVGDIALAGLAFQRAVTAGEGLTVAW